MAEKTETENSPLKSKKPKWMKILEKQSWQAELVISGAAIFGSLQLPGAINGWIDQAVYYVSDVTSIVIFIFFFYLLAVAVILILNFIIHFILRALWIGMLGLVSVYPKGINYQFESYSDDYNQKIKKEFPDINKFNRNLDNLCSLMFAATALGAMIFLSIIFMGLVIGFLSYQVHSFFPHWDFTFTFVGIGSVLLLPGMIQSFFLLKSLREKDWVKRIHFPIFKFYTKTMYNVFYRPTNYIALTLSTNSGLLKSGLAGLVYAMIICFFAAMLERNSNLFLFSRNSFKNNFNSSTYWSPALYEDQHYEGLKIFGPTIPSDEISSQEFKLFIPRFGREQITVDSICPDQWIYNDNISDEENENLRLQSRMECHSKYYQVFMNDSLLTNLKFYNFHHPKNNEPGYITHIPTSSCNQGENALKIKLGYKIPRTDEHKQYRIPFRFRGKVKKSHDKDSF